MYCKWCGMDSATTDRCSWCSGILTKEAETKAEIAETAPPEITEEAGEGLAGVLPLTDEPVKRVPAPPIGAMRRTPAPPVPARSLRTESAERIEETSPAEEALPVLTPTASYGGSPPTDLTAPVSEPTAQTPAAPLKSEAEMEEEFSGLAAGMAKPVEKAALPAPGSEAFNPNPGAVMSKYYPGKTVEETTGIGANDYAPPAQAAKPAPKPARRKTEPDLEINWDKPEISSAAVWGRFAAALAVIIVIAGAIGIAMKPNILVPLLLANFAAGIAIPVLRVGPWQDEDAEDSVFLILLTLIFGPFVSLLIYGVISAVKQMTNPAVLGILIVAAVTRFALSEVAGDFTLSSMEPVHSTHISFVTVLLQWGGLAGMGGWFFANFFHKLHE